MLAMQWCESVGAATARACTCGAAISDTGNVVRRDPASATGTGRTSEGPALAARDSGGGARAAGGGGFPQVVDRGGGARAAGGAGSGTVRECVEPEAISAEGAACEEESGDAHGRSLADRTNECASALAQATPGPYLSCFAYYCYFL